MADVLRRAINQKKQFLKTKLLLSEFYQGRGEQLADYTLSEQNETYRGINERRGFPGNERSSSRSSQKSDLS